MSGVSSKDGVKESGKNLGVHKMVDERRRSSLKYLELITDNIAIKTGVVSKDLLFKNGQVGFYLKDDFRNQILKVIPGLIPGFNGFLQKTRLTVNMFDPTILGELNKSRLFTLSEFAAIICWLISRQPNSEDGRLLDKAHSNIFYVKLKRACVIAVNVSWIPIGRCYWLLTDRDLITMRYLCMYFGAAPWMKGSYVFSHS